MITVIKKGTKRSDLDKAIRNVKVKKKLDAKKFSGILKLDEDPIEIQKRMRDEW